MDADMIQCRYKDVTKPKKVGHEDWGTWQYTYACIYTCNTHTHTSKLVFVKDIFLKVERKEKKNLKKLKYTSNKLIKLKKRIQISPIN